MPDRIQSAGDVCAVLEELLRGRGIFAATPRRVETQLNWRLRFLATDEEAWQALMLRARCAVEGVSAPVRARERWGWSASTFERAWRRGARAIADGLLSERRNEAALRARLDADDRLEAAGKIVALRGDAPLYRVLDSDKNDTGRGD